MRKPTIVFLPPLPPFPLFFFHIPIDLGRLCPSQFRPFEQCGSDLSLSLSLFRFWSGVSDGSSKVTTAARAGEAPEAPLPLAVAAVDPRSPILFDFDLPRRSRSLAVPWPVSDREFC